MGFMVGERLFTSGADLQMMYPFREVDRTTPSGKEVVADQIVFMHEIRREAPLSDLFAVAKELGYCLQTDTLYQAATTAIKRYPNEGQTYTAVLASGQKFIQDGTAICDATMLAVMKPDGHNPGWYTIEMLVGNPLSQTEPAIEPASPMISCAIGVNDTWPITETDDSASQELLDIALELIALTPASPRLLRHDFAAAMLYLAGEREFIPLPNAYGYLFVENTTLELPIVLPEKA